MALAGSLLDGCHLSEGNERISGLLVEVVAVVFDPGFGFVQGVIQTLAGLVDRLLEHVEAFTCLALRFGSELLDLGGDIFLEVADELLRDGLHVAEHLVQVGLELRLLLILLLLVHGLPSLTRRNGPVANNLRVVASIDESLRDFISDGLDRVINLVSDSALHLSAVRSSSFIEVARLLPVAVIARHEILFRVGALITVIVSTWGQAIGEI